MQRNRGKQAAEVEAELQHGTGRSRQKDERMKRIVKKHPPAGKPAPATEEPEGEKPVR